jgi:hypothetical protein
MRTFAAGVAILVAIAPPAFAAVTLSQNSSTFVTDGNSVNCPTGDNSYYRSFDFSDFGIDDDFLTSRVDFGVERASSSSNGQTLTLTVYSGTSLAPLGSVIAIETFSIEDQTASAVQRPIIALAPFSSGGFVIGLFSPAGESTFLIGSNSAGETRPGYIEAPDCAINAPTPLSVVSSGVHVVMSVTGVVPEPTSTNMLLVGVGTLLTLTRLRRSCWRRRPTICCTRRGSAAAEPRG